LVKNWLLLVPTIIMVARHSTHHSALSLRISIIDWLPDGLDWGMSFEQ
jgi:hypothetical protein